MSCELCKESYLDSYNVAVDTLTRENPAFSPHEIRVRAAMQFRPIFHAMEASSAIENAGDAEYENGEFALTPEGEMYFLNTGQRVEQLHINQRRSSELANDPTKYSVTDHQTTRLIQYAIAHGATIVRTSFARDGQNNRDIVEYQYDRLTNRGVIKVINTANNRAQHDFNSIKEIARQRSQRLTEIAPLENVFIFTDAQLRQDRARAVVLTSRGAQPPTVQSIQPEGQKQSFLTHEAFIREEVKVIDGVRGNMFMDTSQIVFRDSGEAIKGMAVFLRDKEKRKEAVKKIRRIFARDDRLVDNHNAAALSLSTKQENERLTIEKIREKPVGVIKEIEKRHAEMRQKVTALLVAAETKVAIGAVPLVLAALAKEQPKPIRAVEKSMRRHEKRELRTRNYELRRKAKRETKKVPVKVQPLETERVEPLRAAKERKARIKRGREIGVKKVAAAELLKPIALEKRERRSKRRVRRIVRKAERVLEAKLVPKKEKKVWMVLAVAAAELASQEVVLRGWREKRPRRRKRIAVAVMSFGWAVWMMLTRKDTETPKNNFKRSHPAKRGATLRSQEETPWILLSIIYYLTVIREQAMHNHPMSQVNPVQQTIPQYAVIYAFAS